MWILNGRHYSTPFTTRLSMSTPDAKAQGRFRTFTSNAILILCQSSTSNRCGQTCHLPNWRQNITNAIVMAAVSIIAEQSILLFILNSFIWAETFFSGDICVSKERVFILSVKLNRHSLNLWHNWSCTINLGNLHQLYLQYKTEGTKRFQFFKPFKRWFFF